MKNFNKLCVLAVFALLGTMAFAKMNGPTGLAVDAKGNLYVANFYSNQIQVYGPTHALVKSKTITTNIAGPVAVALDPAGYVWVANFSSNAITEYASTEYLQTITNGSIYSPTSLSVDGLGDLWVVNGASTLVAVDKGQSVVFSMSASQIGANTLYSVATSPAGRCAYGSDAKMLVSYTAEAIQRQMISGLGGSVIDTGIVIAFDSAGNLFSVDPQGHVSMNLNYYLTLPYVPSGMAVDTARGLLYFSNNLLNNVDIYTVQGVYVSTIR